MPRLATTASNSIRSFGFIVSRRAVGDLIIPGTLWSWGNGLDGMLGDDTIISKSSPTQIPGTTWIDISAGEALAGSIKSDGTLWTWGRNRRVCGATILCGGLGDGTLIHRSSPVQIPGNSWCCINMGSSGGSSLKTDGTLWTWGSNASGSLGDGTNIVRLSPVQVPGNQWNTISGPIFHSLATKTDGTLWAWGDNRYGSLGDGTRINKNSPIQIPGNQWSFVVACGQLLSVGYSQYPSGSSLALKTDGTLWAWGRNANRVLADGTTINKSSPIQIPGTQWNDVSLGLAHVLARKSDGTLWAWGEASSGRLGDNTNVDKGSPVQIPGIEWNDISAGYTNSSARKNNGTLWMWGSNSNGALGDDTVISRSSPVQIPGTQWIDVDVGISGHARKRP